MITRNNKNHVNGYYKQLMNPKYEKKTNDFKRKKKKIQFEKIVFYKKINYKIIKK